MQTLMNMNSCTAISSFPCTFNLVMQRSSGNTLYATICLYTVSMHKKKRNPNKGNPVSDFTLFQANFILSLHTPSPLFPLFCSAPRSTVPHHLHLLLSGPLALPHQSLIPLYYKVKGCLQNTITSFFVTSLNSQDFSKCSATCLLFGYNSGIFFSSLSPFFLPCPVQSTVLKQTLHLNV